MGAKDTAPDIHPPVVLLLPALTDSGAHFGTDRRTLCLAGSPRQSQIGQSL